MKENYYIYAHLNPTNNEIFYIGKGFGERAGSKTGRNKKWFDYINSNGGDYKILIVKDKLSEKEAIELEQKLITKIKAVSEGGTLVNIDGTQRLDTGGIMISIESDILQPPDREIQNKYIGLPDKRIIEKLLEFKNWEFAQSLEKDFNIIYNVLFQNLSILENEDEDQFSDIDMSLTETYELISDLKHGYYEKDEFYEELAFIEEDLKNIESSSKETPLLYNIKKRTLSFLKQTIKNRS